MTTKLELMIVERSIKFFFLDFIIIDQRIPQLDGGGAIEASAIFPFRLHFRAAPTLATYVLFPPVACSSIHLRCSSAFAAR